MLYASLIKYSPSELNVMPGWKQLNQGIVPFAENSVVKSNYADDNLIVQSIDSIMSSAILDLIKNHGPKIASALYSQPENLLPGLYMRVRTVFNEKLDEYKAELSEAEDLSMVGVRCIC